ncbi:MAG: hypothetical protein IKR81_09120, partial [Victivallales bacterium]|nr:hypothetical protein [Victivallales bacterium]
AMVNVAIVVAIRLIVFISYCFFLFAVIIYDKPSVATIVASDDDNGINWLSAKSMPKSIMHLK